MGSQARKLGSKAAQDGFFICPRRYFNLARVEIGEFETPEPCRRKEVGVPDHRDRAQLTGGSDPGLPVAGD